MRPISKATMSEYIEIETEIDEDEPNKIYFYTNVTLAPAGEQELYRSYDDLLEGSPMAQAVAVIDGIVQCEIAEKELTIVHSDEISPYALIADISAAIKDFFL